MTWSGWIPKLQLSCKHVAVVTQDTNAWALSVCLVWLHHGHDPKRPPKADQNMKRVVMTHLWLAEMTPLYRFYHVACVWKEAQVGLGGFGGWGRIVGDSGEGTCNSKRSSSSVTGLSRVLIESSRVFSPPAILCSCLLTEARKAVHEGESLGGTAKFVLNPPTASHNL